MLELAFFVGTKILQKTSVSSADFYRFQDKGIRQLFLLRTEVPVYWQLLNQNISILEDMDSKSSSRKGVGVRFPPGAQSWLTAN